MIVDGQNETGEQPARELLVANAGARLGAMAPAQDYQRQRGYGAGGRGSSLVQQGMLDELRTTRKTMGAFEQVLLGLQNKVATLEHSNPDPTGAHQTQRQPELSKRINGPQAAPSRMITMTELQTAAFQNPRPEDDFLIDHPAQQQTEGKNAEGLEYGEYSALNQYDNEVFPFGFAPLMQETPLANMHGSHSQSLNMQDAINILKELYTPPVEFALMETLI